MGAKTFKKTKHKLSVFIVLILLIISMENLFKKNLIKSLFLIFLLRF